MQRQVRQPASELVTRSKLSCLAWSAQEQSQLIASDYEGIVTLWDAAVCPPLGAAGIDHCCSQALQKTGLQAVNRLLELAGSAVDQ